MIKLWFVFNVALCVICHPTPLLLGNAFVAGLLFSIIVIERIERVK